MTATPLFANRRVNLLLLIDITLIVYVTLFVADFSTLDDTSMMEALQKKELAFSTLAPSAGLTYFRPLTLLSYLLDFSFWGANPAAFHGTNLFMHLLNSCMIYLVCIKIFQGSPEREGASLLSALFFAVTPLNSESVAWVSGRTDILCTLFFLICIMVLVHERLSPVVAFGTLFTAYLCSLLAKESSIALLGIVPLYLLLNPQVRPARDKIALFSAVALGSLIYFTLRMGPKVELDKGTTKVLSGVTDQSILNIAYESIAAYGFYVKKLICPFPLNLAIQTINETLYFPLGIAAVIAICFCSVRFTATRLPLLMIMVSLVPPILVLHGNIPWTLYAERYLYLPMTGFAILFGLATLNFKRVPQPLWLLFIIPLAVATSHRSGQWADPVSLWRDTAEKSSNFPQARVIYAYELIRASRIEEAEQNLNKARSMNFENELFLKCMKTIRNEKRIRAIEQTK